MARRYISDMGPGERIENQVFLIASKDLRQTTQGSLYIHAVLADASGQVVARMWQASESIYNSIPEGGFLQIKGRTENYKGALQFIIEALGPVRPESVDLSEFLPHTNRDIDEMWSRTVAILQTIKDKHLAAMIREFLDDEKLMEAFRKSPAAVQMHHAYIGGLLEHTLNLLEIALLIIPRYRRLSLDLVLAGLFLHDIGKATELSCDTAFGYTDEGQLVGHITQAAIWIDQKAAKITESTGEPFPGDLKAVLQHIVLSHHGTHEFGSPKLPAIPEAIAIHHLDNLDAKIDTFLKEIDRDRDPDSRWSNYSRALATKVYKHDIMGTRDR
jgi:3'-5' exoribonuclease